jgi:hypothetical protein
MNTIVKGDEASTPDSFTISGFFRSEQAIEQAMRDCLKRGMPRDLIDVAVSPEAAQRFYGGRASVNRDSWFSWTGRGALTGLIISALLSLAIVLLPGYDTSPVMAYVQLLGPDIGILLGAAAGAIYGWLKPGDMKPQMLRALHRDDAALLLVHLQPEDEARQIRDILLRHQAEQVEIERDDLKALGAE